MSSTRLTDRTWWVILNSPIVVAMLSAGLLALFVQSYQYSKDQDSRRELIGNLIREYQSRIDALTIADRNFPPLKSVNYVRRVDSVGSIEAHIIDGEAPYKPTAVEFKGTNFFNIIDEIDRAARIESNELAISLTAFSPVVTGPMGSFVINKSMPKFREFGLRRAELYDLGIISLDYYEFNKGDKLKLVGLDAVSLLGELNKDLKEADRETDKDVKIFDDDVQRTEKGHLNRKHPSKLHEQKTQDGLATR